MNYEKVQSVNGTGVKGGQVSESGYYVLPEDDDSTKSGSTDTDREDDADEEDNDAKSLAGMLFLFI